MYPHPGLDSAAFSKTMELRNGSCDIKTMVCERCLVKLWLIVTDLIPALNEQ